MAPPPPRSNNPCVCGSVPLWLGGAAWQHAFNTSLGTPCDDAPLHCSPVLPPAWYSDNGPLLELKALLANDTNTYNPDPLQSWTEYRPACTSTNATGDCVPCDWSQPRCGRPRVPDGALTCNYRFVSCRGRRVVGLHFGQRVRRRAPRARFIATMPLPRLCRNTPSSPCPPHLPPFCRASPSRTSPTCLST